jgi:hypothetical protein
MPCVGFERTITASERAKTVHALDRSATVTGMVCFTMLEFKIKKKTMKKVSQYRHSPDRDSNSGLLE